MVAVLVIDPDPVVRGITSRRLEEAGFVVVRASSIETACKVAEAHRWRFAVIVSEACSDELLPFFLQLPEKRFKGLFVLYVASWNVKKYPLLAYFEKCRSVPRIQKPDSETLLAAVREVVARSEPSQAEPLSFHPIAKAWGPGW